MKWFRVYNELIDDPKMLDISNEFFRLFVYLMCLASECEKNGAIPFSLPRIAWRLRCPLESLEATVTKLKELHIVEENGVGIRFMNWDKRQFSSDNVTARTRRHRAKENETLRGTFGGTFDGTDRTEQNRTEQSRAEVSSKEDTRPQAQRADDNSDGNSPRGTDCPHREIIRLYHEILPELPRVKVWNGKREKDLKARWREDPKRQSLDYWRKFLEYVKESSFLMGTKTDFRANLEWLIKSSNFTKVIEGVYHR